MKSIRIGCLIISGVIVLSGCSNLDIEAAKHLGKVGVEAATAVQTDTSNLDHSIDAYQDRGILAAVTDAVAACRMPKCNPDNYDTSKINSSNSDAVNKLSKLVKSRVQMEDELADAYRAFENLASYDAAAEMETSIGKLFDAGNNMVAAANALPFPGAQAIQPLTKSFGEILKIGGGLVAEERQKRRILAASQLLRQAVAKHAEVLKSEKDAMTSLRVTEKARQDQLRITLRDQGVIGYADTLKPIIIGLGDTPTADLEKAISASKPLKAGMARMLAERSKRQDEEVRSKYAELITSIQQLVKAHEELEAGKPVDLSTIRFWIKRLQSYHSRLQG